MSKMSNQKNIEKYMRRIRTAEENRDSRYRDKWLRLYKRWRNVVDQLLDDNKKPIKDRSNISIPYSFTMLETILPRLIETIFAGRPYVSVQGVPKNLDEWRQSASMNEKPWEIAAKQMENLLDHQQNVSFDIQDKFSLGLKILGLYGTTVAYTGWKYDERKQIRKELAPVYRTGDNDEPLLDLEGNKIPFGDVDPSTGEVIPVTKLEPMQLEEVIYDDPELCFIDLGLFFTDPNSTDIDDARYCGHRTFETRDYLQQMHDLGFWHINWKKMPRGDKKTNDARDFRQAAIVLPTIDDSGSTQTDEFELFEVHHYWEDNKKVVIINRGYIAFEGENPYWHKKKPYVKDVYTQDPGEFYGIGIIEAVEDLQDELNAERNQRIDYRSVGLRRMFTQRRDSKVTPDDWAIKQRGKILVDDHDDIKEWTFNAAGADSFTQETIIKKDMQDATGAHDVVMGTSGSSETATTTMSKDNNASMRFRMIISSVEKRLLVGISRFMIQLNQQFVDDARLIEVRSDDGSTDFLEISPEDIQGEFRLIPAGSSVEPMANKEAHKQRMIELYNVASKDPFLQQYPDKRRNLLRKLLESFSIRDIDNLLPTDEELNGQMHAQLLQQILQQLPPDLQNIVLQYLSGQPLAPAAPAGMPGDVTQSGGGANNALQAESGLQMMGAGGL